MAYTILLRIWLQMMNSPSSSLSVCTADKLYTNA